MLKLKVSLGLILLLCGAAASPMRAQEPAPDENILEHIAYANYEEDTKRTVVTLIPIKVSGETECVDARSFFAVYSFAGRAVQPPDYVLLGFIGPTYDVHGRATPIEQDIIGRIVTAVVDDARLELGKVNLRWQAFRYISTCRNAYAYGALRVPRQTFLRIATGKKVELRVGTDVLPLQAYPLAVLKEFARSFAGKSL